MKQGRAITRYVRISPRKARLAAGLIRRRPVGEALAQLAFSPLKGARLLRKTLQSALANLQQSHQVSRDEVTVVEVRVDEGPRLKRSKSRSKGSSVPVLHRQSHFSVVVGTED